MNPSKVVIRASHLETFVIDVKEHAEKHEETGCTIVGEIRSNGVYVITRVIPAGPRSERSSVSFTTDEKAVLEALEKEMEVNKKIRYLGDMHSHPWPTTPEPSGIDVNQIIEARKKRPWFIIAVFSSTGEVRFFGLDEDNEAVEIPFQVIPDEFEEEDLLSRIAQITDNELLVKIRVGILGCGSLASAVVYGLAGTGVVDYVLADSDKHATVNLVRHVGGIYDIGTSKTRIIGDHIESHNPLACVRTIDDDLIKNRDLLRAIIESCDIIVAASGNPELNYHINSICFELGKPAVYGGIYAGAKSAYVFCVPSGEHACFDCIFDLTSSAVDQNTLKRKYGLEDGELKGAQGMFADIAIPGNIMTKMTLNILLGKEFNYNLVRYYDTPKIRLQNIGKKEMCATCNYEKWMDSEEKRLEEKSSDGKISRITKRISARLRRKKIGQ